MQGETLEQVTARANAGAYIPPPEPTARVGGKRSNMAREFKLPKGAKLSKVTFGGAAKYPWDEWFSGRPERVIIERHDGPENPKGTIEDTTATTRRDYGVPTNAMPPKINTAARRRYKVVDVFRRDHTGTKLDHGGLILVPRDMTAEERVTEDLLRAEEKAARSSVLDEDNALDASEPPPAVNAA